MKEPKYPMPDSLGHDEIGRKITALLIRFGAQSVLHANSVKDPNTITLPSKEMVEVTSEIFALVGQMQTALHESEKTLRVASQRLHGVFFDASPDSLAKAKRAMILVNETLDNHFGGH